jgi:hypothetical protein
MGIDAVSLYTVDRMTDDPPKSRLDIVMERLRRKDEEAGVVDTPLTDAQRTAIAEVRTLHEAQVAQRKIMHQSAIAGLYDPTQLAERREELRRDLDRFERERDEKIKKIRE